MGEPEVIRHVKANFSGGRKRKTRKRGGAGGIRFKRCKSYLDCDLMAGEVCELDNNNIKTCKIQSMGGSRHRKKTRKNKRRRKRGGVKESNAPDFHDTWSKDFPVQSKKDLQQQQLTHGKTNLVRGLFGFEPKKKKAALVHPIGGRKRRTRKRNRNRRSRKNKKSRKHKRSKKGRGIGPFGKQKPLSSENKPKTGDKVRVRGQAGWTVITPMNRAAIVCPPGNTSSNQCSFGEQEIRYNEMTKMGFMGQMGLKKAGGTKNRKSKKSKRSRKNKRSKKGRGWGRYGTQNRKPVNPTNPNYGDVYASDYRLPATPQNCNMCRQSGWPQGCPSRSKC